MSALRHFAMRPAFAGDGSDYDSFAAIYSRWIGKDFAQRALPVIQRVLAAHVRSGSEVLDLCCGCGHITRGLRQARFRVTGLDASENMLRMARKDLPDVMFVAGDARAFTFRQRFAAVVSTFNSLAHVRTDELEQVFRNVRAVLGEGGVFLFDLTMEQAYLARWRGSFSSVADDHACIVRPTYDALARVATNYVTAFEQGASGWKRTDFVIVQKCHPREAVEAALARAGFECVQCLDAQHDLGMDGEAGRTFFLCK